MKTTMYLTQEQLIAIAQQQLKTQYPSLDITIVVEENTAQEDPTGDWIENKGVRPDFDRVDILFQDGDSRFYQEPNFWDWSTTNGNSTITKYRCSINGNP